MTDLPGDPLVHQALLQRVSQSLVDEGVSDERSSFAQRRLQLSKQRQTSFHAEPLVSVVNVVLKLPGTVIN